MRDSIIYKIIKDWDFHREFGFEYPKSTIDFHIKYLKRLSKQRDIDLLAWLRLRSDIRALKDFKKFYL